MTSTVKSFSLTAGSMNNGLIVNPDESGCRTNYIFFANGRESNNSTFKNRPTADRFCGNYLNLNVEESENVEICCEFKLHHTFCI